MNILFFSISMSILHICTLSAPYTAGTRLRVKREDINASRYYTGKSKRSNSDAAVDDKCKPSTDSDSESGRRRRSIRYMFSDLITTEVPPDTVVNLSILSTEFLNCTHITIDPECYERLQNGSVFVPVYKKMFNISDYVIRFRLLFICPNFFDEHEDTDNNLTGIVSLVCTIFSTVCIVLHIVMFIVVKQLRNLPGYCLLSLCVALVGAYICTIAQIAESEVLGCTILGMFMVYFFLASFFWMNAMSYDVWKSIRMATSKFRLTTNRPIMIQFARYSLYAWGTPLIILLLSIIIHFSEPEDSKYRLLFRTDICWFRYKQALTLYFAGPVFTLLGMNVLFFVSSFYMILGASMSKSLSGTQGSSDLWSRLFLSLRLASVMGFMWLSGILALITEQEWLLYLYAACSALQGVFIFCSFTVSERARKAFKKAIDHRKCSSTPTHTSSSQQMTTSLQFTEK